MATRVKLQRQRLIEQILRRQDVSSQAELARLLRVAGERVTQATLSRDLEELGAFKARLPGGRNAYRLPEQPADGGGERLRRILGEFVVDVDHSGNLVVVRTPPGGAHPVARALDASALPGIIGTVAGDDTILVVCKGVGGETITRRLRALAGLVDLKREA